MYLYVALGRMCFWPRPIKFLMWFIAVWFKASHAAKSSEGFVLLLFTVEKMAVRKLATSGQLLQYHTIHKYSATLKVWSQPSEANVPVRNWARVRARAFIFSSVLLCFLLSVSSCLQTGRNGSDTFSVSSTQAQLRDFMYFSHTCFVFDTGLSRGIGEKCSGRGSQSSCGLLQWKRHQAQMHVRLWIFQGFQSLSNAQP